MGLLVTTSLSPSFRSQAQPEPKRPIAALVKKALHEKPGRVLSLADAKQRFERDYLVQLMQISKGNVAEAAKLAKRSRTDFYRLLSRHGLRVKLFKPTAANEEH